MGKAVKKSRRSPALMPPGAKELKQLVAALEQSNARFKDIVENALEWIWEVDAKGKYTYASPIVEEILGYKPEEVLKKHFYDLFYPDDREKLKQMAFAVFAKKQSFRQFINRNVHKNGKTVWLSTSGVPILDGEGNLLGYRGADVDITERKQAEEALVDEATRRRILIDQSRDGIVILDQNGKVYEANQRFAEMLGYSPEEVAQLHVWDWDTQWTREQLLEMFQAVGEAGDHTETRHRRKDGTVFDVEISTNGAVYGGQKLVFCVCRDITKRKRVEQALRESESKFKNLFERAKDAVILADAQTGILVDVNPAACHMLGLPKEKVVGRHQSELHPPEMVEHYKRLFRNHVEKGRAVTEDLIVQRADGSRVPISISASVFELGGKQIIQGVFRDITERKQAEEELKLRAQILDGATDSIFLHDSNGNFLYVNEAACRAHGYSREELIKMKLQQVIAPDRVSRLDADFQEMLEKGSVVFESAHLRKDGSIMPVEVHGRTIESGERKLFLTVIRDITERKRVEEALRETQERLIRSERLAAIGQLASGVGHELRNPLAAIKNAIFYVRRKIAPSDLSASEPKVLEFLDIVDREVSSANKVISDLLGFSRVAKPTASPVSIGSIIESALEHVPVPDNIKLTRDIDPSLPMVMVDGDQIRQVFVNIILNAVEAMPEGGRLEIRAGSKAQFVEVEFADTGGGVPETIIDKIFDPLFTTKAKGIGLGLAMCKSILERHGGDIRVRNEKGKGAVFTASLLTQPV